MKAYIYLSKKHHGKVVHMEKVEDTPANRAALAAEFHLLKRWESTEGRGIEYLVTGVKRHKVR